jgi:hypothetical protein
MDKDHKPLSLGRRLIGAVLMFVAIFAVAAVLSACGDEDNNSGSTGGAVTEAEQGVEEGADSAEEGVEEGADAAEEGAEEAGDAAEEGAEEAGDAAEEGAESVEEGAEELTE